MDNPETIEMKLVSTNVRIHWPCTVCGGGTEKVAVLCEGHDASISEDVDGNLIRVCEHCLHDGDIDGRLEAHAANLEHYTAWLRTLKGRLKVPTFAEWQAKCERADVALAVALSFQGDDVDDTYNLIMADDDAYAQWRKQLQQEEDAHNRRLAQKRPRRSALRIVHTDEACPF